jgi:thymidine kinase
MFSGKTTGLMDRVLYYADFSVPLLLIKHASDTRYAEQAVLTHDQRKLPCEVASSVSDIAVLVEKTKARIVAIDEAQFFDDKLVDWVVLARAVGITVILAGLDRDSRGLVFGPMGGLLAQADLVHKRTLECPCGMLAVQTRRKADAPEGMVGGAERYESVCWTCYYKP